MRGTSKATIPGLLVAVALLLAACGSPEDRANAHYARGVELVGQGEPAKGALEFRNALKLKEDFVDAIFALAEVEEAQGNFDAAARLYLATAERAPEHVDARVKLASILIAAGTLQSAQKFADEALAIAPDDPAPLVVQATLALKRGDRTEAVRMSEAALAADPENVGALIVLAAERLRAGEAQSALALLDRAPDDDGADLPKQLLRLRVLETLGDHGAMEDLFRQLRERYPDEAAFRTGLAGWYLSNGRKDDAEAVFRAHAEAHPDDTAAQFDLVRFLSAERGSEVAATELAAIIARGGDVFDYRLGLAELLSGEGQQAEARDILASLVAETADGADRNQARMRLARLLVGMGETDQAAVIVDEVIAADGRNIEALGLRGSLRLSNGQIAESIADLVTAVGEAPRATPLLTILGEAYERSGAVELAEEQLVKVVQAEGHVPESGIRLAEFLLRYGRTRQAQRILQELPDPARNDHRVLQLLAQIRLGEQDWHGARAIADGLAAEKTAPSRALASSIRAAVLSGEGRYGESNAILEAALARSTDRSAELRAIVINHLRMDAHDAALALLEAEIARDPANVQVLVLLGSVHAAAGRADEAAASFDRAIAADPANPEGYMARAQLHLVSAQLEDAAAVARAGLVRNDVNAPLQLLLGSILETAGDYEGAIATYEAVLATDPRSVVAANNLASLLSEHRSDPASLERAHSIATRFRNAEVPQYLDTLGWIYHRRGDQAAALSVLKNAADRLPDSGVIQYHLGMTLKELGQVSLAVSSLEKAVALAEAETTSYLADARAAIEQLRSIPPAGPVSN